MAAASLTNPYFIASVALFAATLVLFIVTRNPALRRRLRITLGVALAATAAHVILVGEVLPPAYVDNIFVIERLLLLLGVIQGAITLLFHPWFSEHATERAPGIVQGGLVIGIFLLVVTLVFPDQLLAASAVGAVVVGFALQDTLGNFFAGVALQIDPPFKPGHWIVVGTFEGRVTQITWRATKIRTKSGNLVAIPNNVVGKEAITNYSEPTAPTRLSVLVGTSYLIPPNVVRNAILQAMSKCPRVLASPEPDVLMDDFGSSALIFKARFWVDDFAVTEPVMDDVRTAIYYEFHRQGIEIPWPIQVNYWRQDAVTDRDAERRTHERQIGAAFPTLGADVHAALAASARSRLFGRGEVIVREGEPGGSMFVVTDGEVAITIGGAQRMVAVTESGGYFGEMSLLTGDPRAATVTTRRDSVLLEISADAFAAHVKNHPALLDALAEVAMARRAELDAIKSAPGAERAAAKASLLARMRKFFKLT